MPCGNRGRWRLRRARRKRRLALCVDTRVWKARVSVRTGAHRELVPDLSLSLRLRPCGLAAGGERADGDAAECEHREVGEVHSVASVWPHRALTDHLRR